MATAAIERLAAESIGDAVIAIRDHWHTKKHPLFRDLRAGRLPLRALAIYMAQHYKFVTYALSSMGIMFYRSPGDVRQLIMDNLTEEAGMKAGPGEGRVAHDHNELIFRFCKAAGVSEQEVREVVMTPAWWGRNLHYVRTVQEEPVGVILAMQSTQEGQQIDLNREMTIPGLTEHYGYAKTSKEIEFFVEHEVADADHAGRQLGLCVKYLDTPELRTRALQVCEEACMLRWASITDVWRAEVRGDRDPMPD